MSESLGVPPENALSLKLHNTIQRYEDSDLINNMMDSPRETENNNERSSETGKTTPKLLSTPTTPQSTRSTRSRDNPEFVEKQKKFMAKVQVAMGVDVMSRPETPVKRKRESSSTPTPGNTKKRKAVKVDNINGQDYQNDNYCWECHREGVFICCEMCPRVFHIKCAGMEKEPEEDWACSECHAVMEAENIENRSRAMQMISVEQLCTLLKFALNRLKQMPGMEPFTKAVDLSEFPTYREMVVHPVNFISLERNIKRKFYGSTEAFSSDARWIAHNSVIFNGANSKVTAMAKSLVKILKQDMSEIETCPDCYLNAHQKPKTWFIEACRSAHPLIWARLKGFPFWPAKAVKLKDGSVDVRFFGRHDRSWVPLKECFLFSEQMPTPLKNRNKTLEACLQEVSEHIVKLRERFGKFRYAPHRLPYNPNEPEQIKVILPNYKGHLLPRVRGQSRALSRLSGHSDDETSSIASTDSGTSSIRRNRGSGASTTTETEAEIQSEHTKFNSKVESDIDEDENSKDITKENETKIKDKFEVKVKECDKKDDYDEMEGVDLLLGLRNNNDINKCVDSKVDDVRNPLSSLPTRDEDEEFEDEVPKGVMGNSDSDDDDEDDVVMTEDHLDVESKQLKHIGSPMKNTSENKDQPIDGDETSSDKQEKENKSDNTDRRENLGESGGSRQNDSDEPKRYGSGGAGKEDGDDEKENNDRRINDEKEKEKEIEKEEDEDDEDDDEDEDEIDQVKDKEPEKIKTIAKHGTETLPKYDLDINKERNINEQVEDKSLAIKISNFRGISISSVYSEASENSGNRLETKSPLENTSRNSGSVILESKEEKRTIESSKGAIESESMNVSGEKVGNGKSNENNLNAINDSISIERREIEKKIEGFKGVIVSSLTVVRKESMESKDDREITERKDEAESLKTEEKTENIITKSTAIEDNTTNMSYSIESKGYTNKSSDINSKETQNDQESISKSMDCESSINCNESLLKIKSMEMKDEKDDKIKGNPKLFEEREDTKSEDNQKEKIEYQLDTKKTPTSIVNSKKDDTSNELKGNDDSYSFPGVGKGLLDSIRDLNEQLSSESKNINRDNNMEVDGFDYKRKFVEESRSSIIKSAKQSDTLKTSLNNSLTTSSEKTSKECDSNKMDIDNVRKIESFKGVSVSSVVIESKSPDESDKDLGKDVDSKSEDEDKRDMEARRLKDELRKEEKEKDDRDSLAEAVRLVQNMGGIAIKRVETKTSEPDSSNEKNSVSSSSLNSSLSDRVTISVRKEFQNDSNEDSKKSEKHSYNKSDIESEKEGSSPSLAKKSKIPEDKEVEQHISSLGGSVSVTRPIEKLDKEKEKEKKDVQMPSGVDTTRLSPSISIVAVSGSERTKPKTTTAPSNEAPSTTPVSSNPSPAPSTENTGAPSPRTGAPSPRTPKVEGGIPPPPPLTHPHPPPPGPRGVFGPLPPGSGMLGMPGGRGLPMPGHGMRMMGPGGPMMPGGPMRGPPPRHLPPEAGPLSTQLHKHSQKLAEIMRATLEDVLGGLVGTGTPEARLAALQLELERTSWRHQQELAEVRHNADVMLVEMRANLEAEKQRAVEDVRRQMEQQIVEMRRQMERQMVERISEVRRQLEVEKQRAVEETKKKQWCANCGKEALFFCCWNTSYCDYPCQQSHWPQHMSVCGQNNEGGSNAGESGAGGSSAAAETNDGNSGSMNGEASTHSSRNSTPVQNVGHIQQSGNNQMFNEMGLMGGANSPANTNHPTSMGNSTVLPSGSPNLGTRSPGNRGMGNLGGPAMAAMAAMAASGAGGPHGQPGPGGLGQGQPGPHANMKGGPHRFMPPNILQQQMYGGMDPRMMMMMGRGHMPPGAAAAMMRSPMHPHFRPRFM